MNVISLVTPKAQVAYLYDDFTIRQGLEKLRAHGYTAIPVLSREGQYLGTVSEGDFLWQILDQNDNSLRSQEKLPLRRILRKGFNPAVRIDVTMGELLERSMALEKLSREELVRTLDALESALAGRLVAGGEPRRLIRAVDLVRQLRAAARLNAAPGQLAGWLCAGMF